MKAILVPTDFSACAVKAVRLALSFALKSQAHLYFLHLESPPSTTKHVPSVHEEQGSATESGDARYQLGKLVQLAEKLELQATPVLVYADDMGILRQYEKELHIDLIVMGSHGVHGVRDWLLGSNTQAVVRRTQAPVLVVNKLPEDLQIRSMVFASTFRKDRMREVGTAVTFAAILKVRLLLLRVNVNTQTNPGPLASSMEAYQRQFPGMIETAEVDTNDESWGILEFANTYGSDLIVISREEQERTFSKNVAQSLVGKSTVPVLVV
jgi:nucleotide-binding universal stress UspA family protein